MVRSLLFHINLRQLFQKLKFWKSLKYKNRRENEK